MDKLLYIPKMKQYAAIKRKELLIHTIILKSITIIMLNERSQVKKKNTFCIIQLAQTVKRMSTMWEAGVRSLGWEDPLEKEMAIHSSTIAWKIPWTEEPGRLQSTGLQRVGHD